MTTTPTTPTTPATPASEHPALDELLKQMGYTDWKACKQAIEPISDGDSPEARIVSRLLDAAMSLRHAEPQVGEALAALQRRVAREAETHAKGFRIEPDWLVQYAAKVSEAQAEVLRLVREIQTLAYLWRGKRTA